MTVTLDPFNPDVDQDMYSPDMPEDAGDWSAPEPESEPLAETTPDAPYGINPTTGRPYRHSPEERAAMAQRLQDGRRAAREKVGAPARGRRKAATGDKPTRPTVRSGPDYRTPALAVLMAPATGLAVAGKVTGSMALLADSAALTLHAPAIADALHGVALEDPRVAAILDRIGKVSPYGALAAAVGAFVMQVAVNHRMLAAAPQLGLHTPEELLGVDDAGAGVPRPE